MRTVINHAKGTYTVESMCVRDVMKAIETHDLVVTDKNVQAALKIERECYSVEPGESSKSLAQYGLLLQWLAMRGNRRSRIVAIGGGVVGDLAGFAAATFMRGIEYIQVPTSLLAMVDSSVGGKTGIDLPTGKNLVGSFWQPSHVYLPIDALTTLPKRHFINGVAEVWKYGFIADASFVERLSSNPLEPQSKGLEETIGRCIEIKKQVVEEDEFETTGKRAVLNFGHTVGHAIEQCQNYQGLLHGEAVAVGMVVETVIAESLGIAPTGLANEIRIILAAQGLPVTVPAGLLPKQLIAAMGRDKKATRNGLAFSFVSSMGACKLHIGCTPDQIEGVLEIACR